MFSLGWVPSNANLIDGRSVINISGVDLTFGFEAEYSAKLNGEYHYRLARKHESRAAILVANRVSYPFLEEFGNIEDTGNWEVKSKPFNVLYDCLEKMKLVKDVLRTSRGGEDRNAHLLKSFHLHMRFPLSAIGENQIEEFKAWVSRIGDVIIFWRIQHRGLQYALNTWSQHRNEVKNLHRRGTIRLQKIGNSWDIELRGFMSSQHKIYQLCCVICSCLVKKNFPGYSNFQIRSTNLIEQESLARFVEKRSKSVSNLFNQIDPRIFTELEQSTYKRSNDPKGRMNVILYQLHKAPFFNQMERASIEHFNCIFAENLVKRIYNNNTPQSRIEIYYDEIKNWASSLQLHHMYLITLFENFGRNLGLEFEVVVPSNQKAWKPWMEETSKIYRDHDVPAVSASYSSKAYHTWLLKYDRSIKPEGCGYEIVSPVLAWDGKLIEMIKMLNVTRNIIHATVNQTTGLHIHIGLEGISFDRLKTICLNFLNFEEVIDLMMPSHRLQNDFCKSNLSAVRRDIKQFAPQQSLRDYLFASPNIFDLMKRVNPIIKAGDEHSRRYYRINLQRVLDIRTIEFRQHEGTVDIDVTRSWAKFLIHFFNLHEILDVPSNPYQKLFLMNSFLPQDLQEYVLERSQLNAWQILDPSSNNSTILQTPMETIFTLSFNPQKKLTGFLFNAFHQYYAFNEVNIQIRLQFTSGNIQSTLLAFQEDRYFYCRYKFTNKQERIGPNQALDVPPINISFKEERGDWLSIKYPKIKEKHWKELNGSDNITLSYSKILRFGIILNPLSENAVVKCSDFQVETN